MNRVLVPLAIGATVLAAGCGQKGPLYLPDKNVRVITTPQAQPAPAPSSEASPSGRASQTTPASTAPTSPVPPKPENKNGDSETPK